MTEAERGRDGAVVVTGGCGFIGSHFVRLLLREEPRVTVVNVDRLTYAASPENVGEAAADPRYRLVRADIADREAMDRVFEEAEPDLVVNFAAESHVDRSVLDAGPFVESNVRGVQVLLDLCLAHDVGRFVQISTDEVYGDVPEEAGETDEDAPLRPSSPYAATKAAADHLCASYRRTHGFPVLTVRPSNNYGPNQYPEKLIPLALRKLREGEPVPLYGDGEQKRDWLYVEDSTRGILRAVREGRPDATYNFSTGERRMNREVVDLLCELVAGETSGDPEDLRGLVERVRDRPGHDRRYAPDARRARRELGWRPEVGFREGMRRTVRWYLENEGWVRRTLDEDFREYEARVYERSWEKGEAEAEPDGGGGGRPGG